jgi:hypothetical protein
MRMLYLRVSRESNKSNRLSAVTLAIVGPDGPSPMHGVSPIFDAKEAHSIGMTRRLPTLALPDSPAAPVAAASPSCSLCWRRSRPLPPRTPRPPAHGTSAARKPNSARTTTPPTRTTSTRTRRAPKDMRYQERLDRMRFQAAAQHVDRGRVLRQSGDIAGALNQFTRALQIDPGNESAAQEIQITQRAGPGPRGPSRPIRQENRSRPQPRSRHRRHLRPRRAQAPLRRPHHPAHGRGHQGRLPGHRQGGRPQRPLRPRLHPLQPN